MIDILKALQDKTAEINERLRKCGHTVPHYQVKFADLKTTGGQADLRRNIVTLNHRFIKGKWDDLLHKTLTHEIAHLQAWATYRDRGHGAGWKRVMRQLGLKPERCHNYSLEGTGIDYTLVYCNCARPIEMRTRQANKMRSGIKYRCRICKETLTFESKIKICDDDLMELDLDF